MEVVELEGVEEQEAVKEVFKQASKDLGVEDKVTFEGFYNEDTNARAIISGNEIRFNEKHIAISQEEVERVIYHETQHGQNRTVLVNKERPHDSWLFVFHLSFVDLHSRMMTHFEKHSSKGYQFRKEMRPIPKDYDTLMLGDGLSYDHYDEVLALLRGYERFNIQKESHPEIAGEPYEFIDAFKPDDLKILDPEHRSKIADEVIKQNPDILPKPSPDKITIDIE